MKVKNSAIIYAGYDYQTLQGVKLLAEWLHSPMRYTKVAFEADKDSNETPEGIDDIVCERPDGIKDFWQVKFTPTPDKDENGLTWGWLLKISGKTSRSRSLLKKLSDAINSVPAERLGDVVLLTNKRPDRAMASCLRESIIDFNLVDGETKKEVVRQLGSDEAVKFLFSKLTIQHSDGDYQTIRRSVRSELLKVSDDAGVERLIARAREWAMFKNNPPEQGWIYLHHVREILSPKRPDPIPEIFSVPEDYYLPDSGFHNELLSKISSSKGEVITLTGKPGVGKSTYLSYLCQALEDLNVPLIRHHYFLSLGDTTEDRLSPRVVAESLLHQINRFHKESNADTSKPEDLRAALLVCADYYKNQDKPFVVLVDGLDHVWRDNAKNKKPLDEIFRQLLPAADNLVILVGTQPVDDDLLPQTLLTHSAKNEWHWLPEMSGNSIYEFLNFQIESDRLFFNCHEDHVDEELQKSAQALLDITNGYPLHVIYSSEYLAHQGMSLSAWNIEKLPPCSGSNITSYYSELWRNLNYKQRDALHLCSGFQFAWPRDAIGTVLKDGHDNVPSVDAVSHMMSEGLSGVRPFHESLVVFVQNQNEHEARINTLLPFVCDWLRLGAPAHLKDNWLWSSLARAGDSSELRQGLTRDWVLDKLILGMPVKSCIRLLSEAETYAVQKLKYDEAYRHRELKTRLFNGPEFQTWDSTNLQVQSLVGADESYINEIISGKNQYTPIKLSILAIALWYREDLDLARVLSRNAIERYRAKTKLLSSRHSEDDEAEVVAMIKAGVLTDSLNYDAIFVAGGFSNWSDGYIASFRVACCLKQDLNLILKAKSYLPNDSHHFAQFELDAIRLSIIEEVDISCRPEYSSFSSQNIYHSLGAISNKKLINVNAYYFNERPKTVFTVKVSGSYHGWFFTSLYTKLYAEGDYSWLPVSATSEREDVSMHYELLNELADMVAYEILEGNTLSFGVVCSMFPSSSKLDESEWGTRRLNVRLKRGWIEIAADCHLVTTKSKITYDELKLTLDAGVFKASWIRLWYMDAALNLLSDTAAGLLIKLEDERQINELEETIEYSNTYLELAQIAFQHDQVVTFRKFLRKTWDFVLGYGHHKDRTIFEVLKAVEYLSEVNPESALAMLERISPIVFNISEFTDGDETRHSKHSIPSLSAILNPQTSASIYEQELRGGEWSYAEETIQRLLEECDLSSPIARSIYLTGLHSNCYRNIEGRISQADKNAIQIADEIESLLGINIQNLPEDKYSKVTEVNEKITLQPSTYPPEKFGELIAALEGEYSTSNFWKGWYTYWCDQGKEAELVQKLIPSVSMLSDHYDDKRYLLDMLYVSRRKLDGKTKAFDLLVAAHNAMNGWSDWHESAVNSINRLKIVSEEYPKKVDEFIRLTTIQPSSWEEKFGSLIIPSDKLVSLLSHSGRKKEALQQVLAMVESLEYSVRNLNLVKPNWDWRSNDSTEEALTKVLISRLKLPIPTIKLLVIEQISQLLVDRHSKIEELLLEDLTSRKQESECVEVLSVFLVAKEKGYTAPINLGLYVKARSTLSDLILSKLNSDPKNFGSYSYPFTPEIYLDGDNHRFEYYQGNHVPLLYNTLLMKEEKRTGMPFTYHYNSEWNNTFEYQPVEGISIDYFLSGDRQRSTGQFYSQASHRGRSAYLRTIEVAKQFYGMPDSYAGHLAIPALPIEPAYTGLSPKTPAWLPKWEGEVLPSEEDLIKYINDILNSFSEADASLDLLALSLPIKLGSNSWVDLTLVKAVADEGLDTIDDVRVKERTGCVSGGSLLDNVLTYDFSKKEESEVIVLATTSFPFMRYGHWHSDLESRGLYVPNSNIDGMSIKGCSEDGLFRYSVGDITIGFASFWYCNWKPIHPKGVRSLCGSYTAVAKDDIGEWVQFNGKKTQEFYVCEVRVLHAEEDYKDFSEKVYNFTVACR